MQRARDHLIAPCEQLHLLRLRRLISPGAKIRSGGAALGEVAREDWLNERAEYDLRTSEDILATGPGECEDWK